MNTDVLITELARHVTPVSRYAVHTRLFGAGAAGFLASAAALIVWLGAGPDLTQAAVTTPFLFKSSYAATLAVISIAAVIALMRPSGPGVRRGLWLAAPVFAAVSVAAIELATSPVLSWPSLILGQSIIACLSRITILSLPMMVTLFWAARAFAPTNTKAAGGAIGLAAGGLAATIYSFRCVETGACFIALWYTAAIALVGITGMLLGPRVLRW